MKSWVGAIGQFLRHPSRMGAIAPSSAALARRMARMGQAGQSHCVVELGAGSGALSVEFLRHLPDDSRLLCFETDPKAIDLLRQRVGHDPRVEILQRDARDLCSVVREKFGHEADLIVSGLPFKSLGEEEREAILKAVARALAPQGRFVAFQYTPLLLPLFLKYVRVTSVSFEPWNLPPALVIVAAKR